MASQLTLMILEKPEGPAYYRGFDRTWPYYQGQFPEDHPVNQAFLQFCSAGTAPGELHDLQLARDIVDTFSQFVPEEPFELVQCVDENEAPLPGAEFLGHDVSVDGSSLMSQEGLIVRESQTRPSDEPTAYIWQPLSEVTRRYCGEQLNEHGLFANLEATRLFQKCIFALERIRPGLYTGDAAKDFKRPPLKLYLVPS